MSRKDREGVVFLGWSLFVFINLEFFGGVVVIVGICLVLKLVFRGSLVVFVV